MKTFLLITSLLMTLESVASATITSVTARQRYPWNGLVDIDFTISGEDKTAYSVAFEAKDEIGGTNLTMRALIRDEGKSSTPMVAVFPGTYRWVCDASADLPRNWKCSGVSVSADVCDFGDEGSESGKRRAVIVK